MRWADQRRTVAEVARGLGFSGSDRKGYHCPACNEDSRGDHRGAVGVGREGGWRCFRCQAGGDGLDYLSYHLTGKRLRDTSPEEKERVRTWCGGAPEPQPAAPVAPPTYANVDAFWARCYPCPSGDPFLRARGLLQVPPHLARWTPPPEALPESHWPAWWPHGRAKVWRLVTRGWTFTVPPPADDVPEWDRPRYAPRWTGRPSDPPPVAVNLHGRAVIDAPTHGGKPIKTLWGKGLTASGVLFWNEVPPATAEVVVIAEGLTDWLATALWAEGNPVCVFGLTSGGDSAFAQIDVPSGVNILIATDNDSAGDTYAAKIDAHLQHCRCLRVRPRRLSFPKAAK